MYYIAFTLGIFSSLHCVGMCGPLIFAATGRHGQNVISTVVTNLMYHGGRITSYIFLGLFFGLFGTLLAFSGIQKAVSIISGMVLLVIFMFNFHPDKWMGQNRYFKKIYTGLQKRFSILINRRSGVSDLGLGMLNGLLPCGMVYIALAGAVTVQSIPGALGFMLFFGLGTLPSLLLFSTLGQYVKRNKLIGLKKLYPFVSLALGLYLIYRGLFSTLPLELSFYEALKNPVMCH